VKKTVSKGQLKGIRKDVKVLAGFISLYCRLEHGSADRQKPEISGIDIDVELEGNITMCPECRMLFTHGAVKRIVCPYEPKPSCKQCTTHCYAGGYRERIREVMRTSGKWMICHGRLDLLWRYIF
jgi:Nitrous oxide-stimulated promoter